MKINKNILRSILKEIFLEKEYKIQKDKILQKL